MWQITQSSEISKDQCKELKLLRHRRTFYDWGTLRYGRNVKEAEDITCRILIKFVSVAERVLSVCILCELKNIGSRTRTLEN
jgi:hypothetical protein